MTSINSALLSGYYSLPASSDNSADETAASTQVQPASSGTSSVSDPVTVSLSADAQNFLNSFTDSNNSGSDQNSQDLFNSLGSASTDSSSDSTSGSAILLSSAQKQTINDIIAKYKDAPFTQDTFNKIQDDLKAAGLDPAKLSGEAQVKAFNPTQVFLDALNGVDDTSTDPSTVLQTTHDNANTYMTQIFDLWQSTSTQANATADNSSDTGDGTAPLDTDGGTSLIV